MADHPFDEVLKSANEAIAMGADVYQKFTCAKCGNRLTMDTPNVFYMAGTCDKCGHETDIKAAGHNYMLVRSLR